MNIDQLFQIKSTLQNVLEKTEIQSAQIRKDLLEIAEAQPTLIQDGMDHAREEGGLNTRIEIHARQTNLTRQLSAALERIRSGSFGICLGCEEEIDFNRLSAHPIATFCVRCQEMIEHEMTPSRCFSLDFESSHNMGPDLMAV